MLEIKAFFGEWKEATKEQAERFYKTFCEGSAAIKWEDKQKYFNEHFIRGGHVMVDGTVETMEEQKERVLQAYKNRLIKDVREASNNKDLRFIVIEYLCGFSKIDPFVMAASIAKDGIKILFDDSSIIKSVNRLKERKVEKLLFAQKGIIIVAYTRKTKDVYVLLSNYGHVWEEELEEDTRKEAMEQLKTYRENCPQYQFAIKKKRVKI